MDTTTRDQLRDAARRQRRCRKCGGQTRLVTEHEKASREDMFPALTYLTCSSCGNTQPKTTTRPVTP